MSFGGSSPYPRKLGEGAPRVVDIRNAIAADRGDAYSTDPQSIVYAENTAIARTVSTGWGTNVRLGNLWNPYACSPDVLSRWETILNFHPSPKDTLTFRRTRVAKKLSFVAQGVRGNILGELLAVGPAFVALEYVDINSATVFSPDNTYPFGTQDSLTPWASNVARVILRMQKPSGYTTGDLLDAVSKAFAVLDPYLPAWVTFDWYVAGPTFSSTGGLSGAGFYADDVLNTDFEILDS